MNAHVDELDRLIDALNADRMPEENGPVDADLMELLDLARGLKELGRTQWPDDAFPTRTAINLSARLGPTSGVVVESAESAANEYVRRSPLPPLPVHDDAPRPIALPKRRPWIRKSLEIAAGIVVLVAFTGLVALLLNNVTSGSSSPASPANQGASVGTRTPLDDIFGEVKSVDEAGNGRDLHIVKSDAGFKVTLEWVGVNQDLVLLGMTLEGRRGTTYNQIMPASMTLSAASGESLTPYGMDCGQSVCLVHFYRSAIADKTGNVHLHAEIAGLIAEKGSATFPSGVATQDSTGSRNGNSVLLLGKANVDASFEFDFSVPSGTNLPAPTRVPAQDETPTATPSATAASTPEVVSDPTLVSLQRAAGFDLLAPASLPEGLTLEQPKPPMSLPGFTSVVFKYVDSSGKEALTITEASPYQDSAQTMPSDIWNNAIPVEVQSDGYGRVTAHLYQSDSDSQMWWQVGPTSIRLETGGAPGTTMLTKDQLMSVALSMSPVTAHAGSTPEIPSDAKVQTSDQAVSQARAVISSLGGNLQAPASKVSLVPLSEEIALGIPQLNGIDPSAPVWVVQFDDGLSPQGCPDNWVSVCNGSPLVVVVDATSGEVVGFHGQNGSWQ